MGIVSALFFLFFVMYFFFRMKIYVLEGSVFNSNLPLVHCVSRDFRMSKGIARTIKWTYGAPDPALRDLPVGEVGVQITPAGPLFHLITKTLYHEKPNYYDLESALLSLRGELLRWGIKAVAMPRIG